MDPGFLDRGFKSNKGGFDLLILHDYLPIFPDFSENSPEKLNSGSATATYPKNWVFSALFYTK